MKKELKVWLSPGRTGKGLLQQSPALGTFAATAEEEEDEELRRQLQC